MIMLGACAILKVAKYYNNFDLSVSSVEHTHKHTSSAVAAHEMFSIGMVCEKRKLRGKKGETYD